MFHALSGDIPQRGYSEKQLEADIWRIEFGGNGFTTQETVQTYWLYRSAQLTLDKGYDGFEVISNTLLSRAEPPPIQIAAAAAHSSYHPVYIPIYTGGDSGPKPTVVGDIRLLKAPIQPRPPKVFDATQLKSALEPYVNGNKCDMGNVCAHVHRYLMPDTQTASGIAQRTTTPPISASPAAEPATAATTQPVRSTSNSPSPAQISDKVAADFPSAVDYHCPALGTVLKTSARTEFTFTDPNGMRCSYFDESGNARERYALFADGYGRLARKDLDALWPLKVGNSISFDLSDGNAVQPADKHSNPSYRESFVVTGRQRVAVPAGIFDTFVVEWRERGMGPTSGTEALITLWYSPAVGYVVKSSVKMLESQAAGPFPGPYSDSRYTGLTFDATEIAMPNAAPVPVAAKSVPSSSRVPAAVPAALPSSASPADRLVTLKRLLDEKLITREEYDARRKAILDGL